MTTIGTGTLAKGGAVLTTDGGNKIAIYVLGANIYAIEDAGGTPTLIGTNQTPTMIFGDASAAVAWVYACMINTDQAVVVAANGTDNGAVITWANLTSLDSSPYWGSWNTYLSAYNETGLGTTGVRIWCGAGSGAGYWDILFVDYIKITGGKTRQVFWDRYTGSWAGAEQVNTSTAKLEHYDLPTGTLCASNDVEAWFREYATPGAHYRRRNGSWGTENSYTPGGVVVPYAVTNTSGDTVSRLYSSGYSMYVDGADSGYDTNGWDPQSARMVLDGDDYRYIFFTDSGDDVHYIYNTGSGWTDGGDLQTALTYTRVIAEWAYNREYQSGEISYLYEGGGIIYYDALSLGAAPQTVNLDALAALGAVLDLSVVPGAVGLTMDALAGQWAPLAASVSLPTIIDLSLLAGLTAPLAGTLLPGAVTLNMDALAGLGSALTSALAPGAVGVSLDLLAGAWAVPVLDVSAPIGVYLALLAGQGAVPALAVEPGAVGLAMGALAGAGALPALAVQPGPVGVGLDLLGGLGALPVLTVTNAVGIALGLLAGAMAPLAGTVQPGAVGLDMGALMGAGAPLGASIETGPVGIGLAALAGAWGLPVLNVIAGQGIAMALLGGQAGAPSLTVAPGAVGVSLGLVAGLAGTQVLSVGFAQSIILSALGLVGAPPNLGLILGPVGVELAQLGAIFAPQWGEVAPGGVSVGLALLTASEAVLGASVAPGAATVNMGPLSVLTAPPALSIWTGTGVNLGLLGAAGSALLAAVIPGAAGVSLAALAGAGVTQALTVQPGAVGVGLDLLAPRAGLPLVTVAPGPMVIAMAGLQAGARPFGLTVIPGAAGVMLATLGLVTLPWEPKIVTVEIVPLVIQVLGYLGGLRQGDYGMPIRVLVTDQAGAPLNVGDPAVRKIYLERPDGIVLERTAVPVHSGPDGLMQYMIVDGDLSMAGRWRVQGHVTIAGQGAWYTEIGDFQVGVNL